MTDKTFRRIGWAIFFVDCFFAVVFLAASFFIEDWFWVAFVAFACGASALLTLRSQGLLTLRSMKEPA